MYAFRKRNMTMRGTNYKYLGKYKYLGIDLKVYGYITRIFEALAIRKASFQKLNQIREFS